MRKGLVFWGCVCLFVCFACSKEDEGEQNSFAKEKGVAYSRVNLDRNNPEIATIVSENKDTLLYYGTKNDNGTVKNIEMMKISSSQLSSVIRFDKKNRPNSIICNNGVSIDLEWESASSVVVNASDPNSNLHISTVWYLDSIPDNNAVSKQQKLLNKDVRKSGVLNLSIKALEQKEMTRVGSVDDYPALQSCFFNISQCDYPIDVDNCIGMFNALDNSFLGNIYYDETLDQGKYKYTIPLSSYPSKASNAELCKQIDVALNVVGLGLKWFAAMDTGLAVWLNYAALMIPGVGVLPAAITNALWLVAVAGNFTLDLIDDAGGVDHIMQSLNPEWYYKEYIASDLFLIPTVFHKEEGVCFGDKMVVNPGMGDIVINQEIPGTPTIDSFELYPSHPYEFEKYSAVVTFHCIPIGSKVEINIVGTDGYYDSIEEVVNVSSGNAVLWVPGAETGVYDVCSVKITTPTGKTYSMQASLVFG